MMLVDGRGKIGGHVATKNRSGAVIRTKVTPSNPQTSAQVAARAKITNFSKAWSGLTDSDRAAWNNAVTQFAKSNIFGDRVNPSGFNLYVALNSNIAIAGGTAIDVPPIKVDLGYESTFSATAVNATGVVTLTFAPAIAAGTVAVIEATPSLSPGLSFVKNKFRIIKIAVTGDVSPLAVTAEYAAKFGAPGDAGQKIHFRAKLIDTASGLVGAVVSTTAVIS